jgi:hypothetical protein
MDTADSYSLAQLETQSTFFTTQTTALAQQLSTLAASVDTDIATANAAITQEQTTRASEIEAVALMVTTLDSSLTTDISDANALISSEAGTRANAVEAVAGQVTQLETDFQTDLTSTQALVTQEASTRSAENLALAQTVSQLSADLTTTENSINASLSNQDTVLVTLDSAVATAQQTLVANYDTLSAGITSEAQARASETSALSGTITSHTTQLGDMSTTVTQTAESVDGIEGEYGVKIDANGRVAGFGLINGPGVSAFDIVADKFSIANPDSPTVKDLYYDSATNTLKFRGQLILSNGANSSYTVSDLSDIQAQDGDTIYVEFAYSADNTNWHDQVALGDTYIRTRTVTNGVAGDWGDATNLKGDVGYTPVKGTDYDDGISGNNVRVEYSTDDTTWVTTQVAGITYLYIRTAVDTNNNGVYVAGLSTKFVPEKGTEYDDGDPGTNAYVHIKYSDNGTSFTHPDGEDVGSWIGTLSDSTLADSTTFSDYAWKKIVGADGYSPVKGTDYDDGVAGNNVRVEYSADGLTGWTVTLVPLTHKYIRTAVDTNGNGVYVAGAASKFVPEEGSEYTVVDGVSSYLHIKYSDDGIAFTSPDGETPGTYIGTLTDTTLADSTTFADYTWQKYIGDDGYSPVKGVDYYDGTGSYISYIFKTGTSTPTKPTTGSFTGTSEVIPTGWQDDPYVTAGSITYVSKRTYTQQLTTGGVAGTTWNVSSWSTPSKFYEKGATGDDGSSYTGTTEYYRLSNSTTAPAKPTTFPGLWSTSPQTPTATYQYLWNFNVNSRTIGNDIESPVTLVTQYVADGRGISSITEQYAKSSSTTTAPTTWGTYANAVPLTVASPYLWNKTTTNYTVGAATSTSTIIAVRGTNADALTVTSSTSGGATTLTFSDGTTAIVNDGTSPAASGVKVAYATNAAGTSPSFTQGSRRYANYVEWTGTAPTSVPAGLTYTLFIGTDGDHAGVIPIYADNATGTGASFTDSTKDYVNFYEWTGTAPTTPPSSLTYVKFVGNPGADSTVPGPPGSNSTVPGPTGTSGAGFYRYGSTTGAWPSTSTANSYLLSAAGRVVVQDDVLTIYKTTDPTVSSTRRYTGSSWATAALLIDGDMIATGTIAASRLSVTSLSSINADIGTVTAGKMVSSDGKFEIDLNNKFIRITV